MQTFRANKMSQDFRQYQEGGESEERVGAAKFGEVALTFILSTPDPINYTYYTELLGECHEEGI